MNTKTLFEEMRKLSNRIAELAHRASIPSNVVRAGGSIDLRRYASGSSIEAYVEAELDNGTAITWVLESSVQGDHWRFEPRIVRNDEEGETTLAELPSFCVASIEEAANRFYVALLDAQNLFGYITAPYAGECRGTLFTFSYDFNAAQKFVHPCFQNPDHAEGIIYA